MATAYNNATGQTSAVAATAAPAGDTAETKKKKQVMDAMNQRGTESQAGINSAYDANLGAQKQALLNAYNANTQAQTQQGQNIQKTYEQAGYDVGVQNARNQTNLDQFADVRNVNRQMGSQQALSLGNAAARANAAIDFQKQQALQENERQKQMLTMNYNNQVQAALADNDYKRAAALLDDYNNQQKWNDQQAQILASYGNFDPYKNLYGDTAGSAMQAVCNAQNPEVAYRTGAIDAEAYKNITGKYPAGYTPPSYGYGLPDGWWNWTPEEKEKVANLPYGQNTYFYNSGRSVTRAANGANVGKVYYSAPTPDGGTANQSIMVVKK